MTCSFWGNLAFIFLQVYIVLNGLCFLSLNRVFVSDLGAQTDRSEEGLAEGDGCGVRLQTVPLRAGRRKSHTTKCSSQPSYRYEVREA